MIVKFQCTHIVSIISPFIGRPFPLKGRFYANIFIHFEPTGHALYENTNQSQHDRERDAGIPVYVLEDSEEAQRWRKENKNDWEPVSIFIIIALYEKKTANFCTHHRIIFVPKIFI